MAKRTSFKGIRDWDEKIGELKRLFIVETMLGLAQAILGVKNISGNTLEVGYLEQSLNKWGEGQSSPTGRRGIIFKGALIKQLVDRGCKKSEQQIAHVIVHGSIQEFKDLIPENFRVINCNDQSNQEMETNQSMIRCEDLHHLWFTLNASPVTAKHAFENGRIDQKFHYLSPDSEEIWRGLIANNGYRQFDECKFALDVLCTDVEEGKVWYKFFTEGGANGVIMLGGGSVPKDMVIIRETLKLLPPNDALNYTIVDYSHYMLKSSYGRIYEALIQENLAARVNLNILEHDFLKLKEAKGFRHPAKNVAWIIPGGTIGNINEGVFLDSVAGEAMSGDLLVIGAETIEIGNTSMCDSLVNKYQSPEVRRFLETPLRSVWHELKCTETIESALNRIDVNVVDGVNSKYSDVTHSRTVELSLDVNGRKIVLATSTRYVEENLIEFAAIRGFKYETSIKSPLNPRYKQFVFRYDTSA